jgi:cysteinyl-tRNA synthetase
MIEALIEKDHAYVGANGDVYYRVSSFDGYGRLSGKRIEDLRAGARVDVEAAKEDPLDFALWKAAKPGEPQWDSPWGPGRPGWHIECSAMSTAALGDHFDIHGGGMDLKFPHHENEIAQSCGATDRPFVNVWMHNGFLQIDEEKMSKSLGNFFTIREVLEQHRGEVVRYFVLLRHYRRPLNYSEQDISDSRSGLDRLYRAMRGAPVAETSDEASLEHFRAAMDDDFNTAGGLAARAGGLAAALRDMGGVMGILQEDAEAWFKHVDETGTLSDADIDGLIESRNRARADKDWAEADRIRDELAAAGIVLEDGSGGTTWRRG